MTMFYRRLPKFDYLRPESLQEALALVGQDGGGGYKVYAGGTDLIPKIKGRMVPAPQALVDLKGIPDLDGVSYDREAGLRIGALASIHEVAVSAVVRQHYPMLSQAASSIASRQIRNRGTIAGNICNAVPSADSAPALLCLGASVVCAGPDGDRTVNLTDFFTGPNRTVLGRDELVREIVVPPARGNGTYIKLSPRSSMDLAVVGVAAVVDVKDGLLEDVRIGLGAVSPTPMRALEAEGLLKGKEPSEAALSGAAAKAAGEARPIDDHRASAEYRRMMVEVLVRRAVAAAAGKPPEGL